MSARRFGRTRTLLGHERAHVVKARAGDARVVVARDHQPADRELLYRHVDAADSVQLMPSFDHSPTKVEPVRPSCTHFGAAPAAAILDASPFALARYCIATPARSTPALYGAFLYWSEGIMPFV